MTTSDSRGQRTGVRSSFVLLVVIASSASGFAFTSPVFTKAKTVAKTAPSDLKGVEIEMPNFDELFGRIQQISPLARQAIEDGDGEKGFGSIDDTWPPDLKWKVVESHKNRAVHHIDKIDNFMKLGPPLIRFRASLKGPCLGHAFARMLMDLETRKKWDSQVAESHELYPVEDLDTVNFAMGHGKYGECSKFGVGYCKTKANLGISSREQLILCGIQDFEDGSSIFWGTEMDEWHNHLLPPGKRVARAKSHILCGTLVPTSDDTFDIEYVSLMDIGGNFPKWLHAPVLIDTLKHLFKFAESFFAGGEGSELDQYLSEKQKHDSLGGVIVY